MMKKECEILYEGIKFYVKHLLFNKFCDEKYLAEKARRIP